WDADAWLEEHRAHPLHHGRDFRNREWFHMINDDIISMPDKWEYPWYAAWDLAFHTLPIGVVDPDFAKQQMELMLRGFYLHPSGQIPAYEWNFSDVNPPVHAAATLFLHRTLEARGEADIDFLKSAFNKLMLNFTWWVNRKDRFGKNVFEGGFLGLDNIGVFDRSAPLPTGGYLEQADGTAWMALFTQNMLELAVELAAHDRVYEDMAFKFVEHFFYIAAAMNQPGQDGMWDEEDGFYYDLLRLPDGSATRLKVRSMVGLLPLCATTVIEKAQRERVPRAADAFATRLRQMPELLQSIHPTGPGHTGVAERGIFALVTPERLRRILSRMLDENEFLSPYGIRSLSKFHEQHPYVLHVGGQEYRVDYLPAESNTGMFGGNSNWRGPVWMPVNVILIRGLLNFYGYYGDNFKIECPTGSGKMMNLFEVAKEIVDRLARIFLRDERGRRAVYGGAEKFQTDPQWCDLILFYEYFHGDNGAGLGASHQTGWTGLVAKLIQL
ncbi:MAG: MGH1-like glycoside hydrolase domain-containing protein, partial [Burkholderiales bacterium]